MKIPDFGPLTAIERMSVNYHNMAVIALYGMGFNFILRFVVWSKDFPRDINPTVVPSFFRQWRHLKRGSTYVEIERVPFQRSTVRTPIDGDEIVIYRCIETGKAYARMTYEFEDGRFEEIK
jgi:hypothetical protein